MSEAAPNPAEDPVDVLLEWLADAEAHADIRYAGAATLATVDGDGVDARVILVHAVDDRGLLFGTDTRSPKARQLRSNPAAALTLYWGPLERQVRVRGAVEPCDGDAADETFNDRPRGSRVTAWACQQSREVTDRGVIESRFSEAEALFAAAPEVPRPDTWRAYRLVPERFELWSAGRFRLHRRRGFERKPGGGWRRYTLEP
ncbi:MAG: pyridoxal 5'-phosphate synthase [Acidobacteriota bacterium]